MFLSELGWGCRVKLLSHWLSTVEAYGTARLANFSSGRPHLSPFPRLPPPHSKGELHSPTFSSVCHLQQAALRQGWAPSSPSHGSFNSRGSTEPLETARGVPYFHSLFNRHWVPGGAPWLDVKCWGRQVLGEGQGQG